MKSLLLSAWAFALMLWPAAAQEPARVEARQVSMPADIALPVVRGELTWVSTLQLTSRDFRFGGYSGLWVDASGEQLFAVSDKTGLLQLRLLYDASGALTGVADAEFSLLCGETGAPFLGLAADAESLSRLADGSWLVSFEQKHRFWRYRTLGPGRCALPEALPMPPGAQLLRGDSGFEALAVLDGGGLFAIAERPQKDSPALHAAFRWDGAQWREKIYRSETDYSPTEAVMIRGGDILVLERYFRPGESNRIRVRRITQAMLANDAIEAPIIGEIAPPLPIDNMEGLAVFERDGVLNLLMISDDNFNDFQRTLLMQWRWKPMDAEIGAAR